MAAARRRSTGESTSTVISTPAAPVRRLVEFGARTRALLIIV